MKIALRAIAHSRAGDKDDTSNVSVIAYRPSDYELILRAVTVAAVRDHFGSLVKGEIVRYELPKLNALNFVMKNALDGGNTRSLRVDGFGKSLSALMLSMYIEADVPALADRVDG